jgi:hypothetical protein
VERSTGSKQLEQEQRCSRHKQELQRLRKQERQQPNLMTSRRPIRSHLLSPPHLIQSGEAAFSLKNGLFFLKHYSNAGMIAGVFFGYSSSVATKSA